MTDYLIPNINTVNNTLKPIRKLMKDGWGNFARIYWNLKIQSMICYGGELWTNNLKKQERIVNGKQKKKNLIDSLISWRRVEN